MFVPTAWLCDTSVTEKPHDVYTVKEDVLIGAGTTALGDLLGGGTFTCELLNPPGTMRKAGSITCQITVGVAPEPEAIPVAAAPPPAPVSDSGELPLSSL